MVMATRAEVKRITNELGDKPDKAASLVNGLNSQDRKNLAALGIRDRTETIEQAQQILVKRQLVTNADLKQKGLAESIINFQNTFNSVVNKGFPSFFYGHGELYDLDKYKEILWEEKENESSIAAVGQVLKGK